MLPIIKKLKYINNKIILRRLKNNISDRYRIVFNNTNNLHTSELVKILKLINNCQYVTSIDIKYLHMSIYDNNIFYFPDNIQYIKLRLIDYVVNDIINVNLISNMLYKIILLSNQNYERFAFSRYNVIIPNSVKELYLSNISINDIYLSSNLEILEIHNSTILYRLKLPKSLLHIKLINIKYLCNDVILKLPKHTNNCIINNIKNCNNFIIPKNMDCVKLNTINIRKLKLNSCNILSIHNCKNLVKLNVKNIKIIFNISNVPILKFLNIKYVSNIKSKLCYRNTLLYLNNL